MDGFRDLECEANEDNDTTRQFGDDGVAVAVLAVRV